MPPPAYHQMTEELAYCPSQAISMQKLLTVVLQIVLTKQSGWNQLCGTAY